MYRRTPGRTQSALAPGPPLDRTISTLELPLRTQSASLCARRPHSPQEAALCSLYLVRPSVRLSVRPLTQKQQSN